MADPLLFEDHLDGILEATSWLAQEASQAGSQTPVPTCPQWNVAHLVAHQGMVHRWVIGRLRGLRDDDVDFEQIEQEGLRHDDVRGWLLNGGEHLVAQLRAAPPDIPGGFFMDSPLPPRESWARRQCHETTMHAVDALASRIGRRPRTADAELSPHLAVDGIDELLCSFLPRAKFDLRSSRPVTVTVHTSDTGDCWLLEFGEHLPRVHRARTANHPDATVSGTAVGLYLGLWNRGTELTCVGRDVLSLWRDRMAVTWD